MTQGRRSARWYRASLRAGEYLISAHSHSTGQTSAPRRETAEAGLAGCRPDRKHANDEAGYDLVPEGSLQRVIRQHPRRHDQPRANGQADPVLPLLLRKECDCSQGSDRGTEDVDIPRCGRLTGVSEHPRRRYEPQPQEEVGHIRPAICELFDEVAHVTFLLSALQQRDPRGGGPIRRRAGMSSRHENRDDEGQAQEQHVECPEPGQGTPPDTHSDLLLTTVVRRWQSDERDQDALIGIRRTAFCISMGFGMRMVSTPFSYFASTTWSSTWIVRCTARDTVPSRRTM